MNEEQAKHLDDMRYFYERGLKESLFNAITYCGEESIAMPDWVWKEFTECANWYIFYHAKTLDEAFDIERPIEVRFDDMQRRVHLSHPVCERLKELIDAGEPKDDNTYFQVAEEFGIGKELVKKYRKLREVNQPDYFSRKK